MLERVRRMMRPIRNMPSVMAGSTTWEIPPMPEAGSHRRCTANTVISTRPSQKPGMDWPSSASAIDPWSQRLSRFTAEITPIGMPMRTAKLNAPAVSKSVAGSRSSTTSRAGRCARIDVPRSPCRARPRKRAYWSTSGWSRPSER